MEHSIYTSTARFRRGIFRFFLLSSRQYPNIYTSTVVFEGLVWLGRSNTISTHLQHFFEGVYSDYFSQPQSVPQHLQIYADFWRVGLAGQMKHCIYTSTVLSRRVYRRIWFLLNPNSTQTSTDLHWYSKGWYCLGYRWPTLICPSAPNNTLTYTHRQWFLKGLVCLSVLNTVSTHLQHFQEVV